MKTINKSLFCIYILMAFTPILGSMYVTAIITMLWVLTAIIIKPSYWTKIKGGWILAIILWLGYEMFLKVIGYSIASWGNYGVHILYFFPVFVFLFYKTILSEKEIKQMLVFGGGVLWINMLYNIYLLIRFPNANIELNFSNSYSGLNLGNSDFTLYIMAFLLIASIMLLRNNKKSLLIIIPGLVYLVMSSKTTCLLVFLIVFIVLFLDKITNKLARRYKIITMITATIAILFFYRNGLNLLLRTINNDYIASRIEALLTGDLSSAYLSRWSLAGISMKSFLSHPIFGVGYVKVSEAFASSGIGHHSEIIDHLGRYGIVGGIFYFVIYSGYWRLLKSLTNDKDLKRMLGIYCLGILLYSFLNNSCFIAMGIILFYMLPAVTFLNDRFEYI